MSVEVRGSNRGKAKKARICGTVFWRSLQVCPCQDLTPFAFTEAKTAIMKALKMSPRDKLSQTVRKAVDEVIRGNRKPPKTMADLK